MGEVIDFQKKVQEKEKEEKRIKKEFNKRRRFVLNMEEANILINSYINYINEELEDYQEFITDEDKEIGKNEIKTMFSLLRMLFKKYKSLDYYDDIVMSWNYKNLYYTVMASYASLDTDDEYEYLEQEEKIELNLYYRLVDLENEVSENVHGPAAKISESPEWLSEEEFMAENDYLDFKHHFYLEFLDKVVLMEDSAKEEGRYYVKQFPETFAEVLEEWSENGKAEYYSNFVPKGWRVKVGWEELVENISSFNVEVIPAAEQGIEEVAHIYSVELLEEQIADMINRMESIGMKISSSFIDGPRK